MKLTFKEIVNREIDKEYEDWIGSNIDIRKYRDGSIEIEDEYLSCVMSITNNEVFILEKKEVSLNEALKALEEGKEIESVASGYKFKKGVNDYISYKDMDYAGYYEDEPSLSIEEAKGKWHIND